MQDPYEWIPNRRILESKGAFFEPNGELENASRIMIVSEDLTKNYLCNPTKKIFEKQFKADFTECTLCRSRQNTCRRPASSSGAHWGRH